MRRFPLFFIVIMLILPAWRHSAVAAEKYTKVTFEIGEGVSEADEVLMREGIRLAQDFFIATFGADLSQPVTVTVAYDPTGQTGNFALDYGITMNTWSMEQQHPAERMKIAVHEYFHLWQAEVGTVFGQIWPVWLLEGTAEYVAYQAVIDKGLIAPEVVREVLIVRALSGEPGPPLSDLAAYENTLGYCCLYLLSSLAVEALAGEGGARLAGEFFSELDDQASSTRGWEPTFTEVFGRSVDDFYAEFEAQRAAILTPAGIDVTSQLQPAAINDFPAEVSIISIPESVDRGGQALLQAVTAPGARCSLDFVSASGNPLLTYPAYADIYGNIFWLWSVREKLSSGAATVSVGCGSTPVTVEVNLE